MLAGEQACASATPRALKIDRQDVLGVVALHEPDVDRQAGGVGEAPEERRGQVGLEAAGPRRRQIGVRRDERLARGLDDDHRERLVGRDDADAATRRVRRREQRRERVPERACLPLRPRPRARRARSRGSARSRRCSASSASEMVEDRDPRGDARRPRAERDPRHGLAVHRSARSMLAPSARRRSSMRS